MGALDKVFSHDGRVFRMADVSWKILSNLLLPLEKSGAGGGDPSWEKAGEVWSILMDGLSMMVGLYVDLGIWSKFFVGFLTVLMTFDMENIDGDGHCFDKGLYSLDDVIVWADILESRCLVIRQSVDVLDYTFIVDRDWE